MKQGNFTDLARHYHNRPAYSTLLLEKLLLCINDGKKPLNKLDIAEVGAGTGKLTAILARDFGLKITAVEPNDAMREEGIKATQGLDIKWLKGSGEQTNLQSNSADWLIMASSFHWTDPTKSLPEFARVLRGGNSQNTSTHPHTPSAQQGALIDKPRNERERERERRLRQNLLQIHKSFLKATRKARKTHILQSSTTHEI
ncbi:class I SAM-dependent methyltransferase [Campylobacter troglodytis]|nr:class I SAM-dependent methyltransferase [Campylobacter troglodytis]